MIFIPYYFFFVSSILFGVFISISRCRWLYIWIGLEVNLLSFVPLVVCGSNNLESEAAIKYFLVQALGSCVILFSYFSFMNFINCYVFGYRIYSYIIIIGLILKIGIFPFHHWLPQVMNRVSWFNCFLLSVIQKIAPGFILCFIMYGHGSFLFFILGSLGSVFGGYNGINQRQLRVILAYSSIGHLGWILCSIHFSFFVFFYYFIIYSLISSGLMLLLNLCTFKVINLNGFINIPLVYIIFIWLSFLSLSGLPPFLGFYSKLLVIYYMVYFKKRIFCSLLVFGSLINLFYYLNIFFNLYITSVFKNIFFKEYVFFYKPLLLALSIILSFSYLSFGFLYLIF